jgi:hypothetical protein
MKSALASAFRSARSPLFWYYALTVVVPLANGGARGGRVFGAHLLAVSLVPPALVVVIAMTRKLVDFASRVFTKAWSA